MGHRCKVRVIYADTDAMGIVYHTNYIKWFEVGRAELFRDRGMVYTELEARGFNLPLTEVYCHYLAPARYDDLVVVETSLVYLRRASMKFAYVLWDETETRQFAEGWSIHACTDREGRIARLPEVFLERIRAPGDVPGGAGGGRDGSGPPGEGPDQGP